MRVETLYSKRIATLMFAILGIGYWAAAYPADPTKQASFAIPSGDWNCQTGNIASGEHRKISLNVSDGTIKKFDSVWSTSSNSPDLRPGYTSSCQIGIEKFRQQRRAHSIRLTYSATDAEADQKNCEVRIWQSSKGLRIQSSKCSYPCLELNFLIDERSSSCIAK
jgi:hypothetical protein